MKNLLTIINYSVVTVLSISFLFFLEAFFFPGIIEKYLQLDLIRATYLSLPLLVLLRFVPQKKLPEKVQLGLTVAAPLILSVHALFTAINKYWYGNFSFSTFHLHAEPFKEWGLFLSAIALLFWNKNFVLSHWKLIIGLLPIWLLNLSYHFYLSFESVWFHLEKEDSLFEWLTILSYVASAIYAAKIAFLFKKTSIFNPVINTICMVIFSLIAIGSVLIAGEEMSWAQRLIGYETPENIKHQNTQLEFNIHNNKKVFRYVYDAYVLLAAYCSVSWIISAFFSRILKNKNQARFITLWTPPAYLFAYFPATIIYVYIRQTYGSWHLDKWEEFVEFLLASGVSLYILHTWRSLRRIQATVRK